VVSQEGFFLKELKHKMISKLHRQITRVDRRYDQLQNLCDRFDHLANRPAAFLLFLSKTPFAYTRATPKNVTKLAFRVSDDKIVDRVKTLNALADVGLTEDHRKRTHLKLMQIRNLVHSFNMTDISHCSHINCVTPTLAWISDYQNNLILTGVREKPYAVHRVHDGCSGLGVHAVTVEGDLVYIDRESTIKKLSTDFQENQNLIEIKDNWRPRCIYSSQFNGDLFVGMWILSKPKKARVVRFNKSGKELQDSLKVHRTLYKYPVCITENLNGDVIVADLDKHALMVTDLEGIYRFSYTGPSSETELDPRGVCTDALGHILVCDWRTRSVQIIDRNGQFLSSLLTNEHSKISKTPYGISYNHKSHLLWVGYDNSNRINVFQYLT
jgi:hypothetical protein